MSCDTDIADPPDMPGLDCCGVMKRKSNGVTAEDVGKRSRLENGETKEEREVVVSKCSICLWPLGSPQCYHAEEQS